MRLGELRREYLSGDWPRGHQNSKVSGSTSRPSTKSEFEDPSLSSRRLSIRDEESTADGNVNLRTEMPIRPRPYDRSHGQSFSPPYLSDSYKDPPRITQRSVLLLSRSDRRRRERLQSRIVKKRDHCQRSSADELTDLPKMSYIKCYECRMLKTPVSSTQQSSPLAKTITDKV